MAVAAGKSATGRRVLYGINALLQGVLAIALLVGVIWLAGQTTWEADLTRTGVNSLSPRTVKLVEGLDQDIRITALFPEPDKRDEEGAKRLREVKDLLALYDRYGGEHIDTYVVDPTLQLADVSELRKRLNELPLYRDEANPHREAVQKFNELFESAHKTLAAEYEATTGLIKSEPALQQNREYLLVCVLLQTATDAFDSASTKVQRFVQGSGVPRYGDAANAITDSLTDAESALGQVSGWLSTVGPNLAGVSANAKATLAATAENIKPVLASVTALLATTGKLETVKLDELMHALERWPMAPPILVESATEARVIPNNELWVAANAAGGGGNALVFAGEAAISSAILQLTQKDKTAVVFTYFGGPAPLTPDFSNMQSLQELPRAPYQALGDMLRQENFETAEWDVSQAKTPPEVEGATRRVYVVFAPQPPPRPNPMQPSPQAGMTPADRDIVLNAVRESGMALFLAGWRPSPTPFPEPWEYNEYLRTEWGLEVDDTALAWQFVPDPSKTDAWRLMSRDPILTTDGGLEFGDHPIGKALRSQRTALYAVTPLKVLEGDARPAGVTVGTVARVPATDDVWAITELARMQDIFSGRQRECRPVDSDIRAPFPVAVAAENEKQQRVVVIGSEAFAVDQIAMISIGQAIGNMIRYQRLYPGNQELVLNSLHWLTNDADRISVGPRLAEAPVLGDLDRAWADRLPWFMVGIWPAVALVVGIGVWLVRRR